MRVTSTQTKDETAGETLRLQKDCTRTIPFGVYTRDDIYPAELKRFYYQRPLVLSGLN
jgi:hypothetical protein